MLPGGIKRFHTKVFSDYLMSKTNYYNCLLLLPVNQDVKLSAPSPAPCVSACHHTSPNDGNGIKLWKYKPASAKYFPL